MILYILFVGILVYYMSVCNNIHYIVFIHSLYVYCFSYYYASHILNISFHVCFPPSPLVLTKILDTRWTNVVILIVTRK